MTALSQSTKRKHSLLQLAAELDNVSKVCSIMGYHRASLYETKRAFQMGGIAALVENHRVTKNSLTPQPGDRRRRAGDPRLFAEVSDPQAERTANELRLTGVAVSGSGVRGIWLRHDIETRHKRLLRLEEKARDNTFVLTARQAALLEYVRPEFHTHHVETSRPSELLNQDTLY